MNPKPTRYCRSRGSTLPEYGLLLAFGCIVLCGALTFMGDQISAFLNDLGTKILNTTQTSTPGSAGTP